MKMGDVTVTDVYLAAPLVPKYRVFNGARRADVESEIASVGMRKASIGQLMRFRLDALASKYEPDISEAWDQWHDADTWIAYWNGKVKIGDGFQMPENPQLRSGALVRTVDEFNALKGKTFLRKDLKNIGTLQTLKQVLKDPVWRTVGGKVLNKYARAEFRKYSFTEAMGVYLADELDVPTQRPLALGDGDYGRSGLGGYGGLDDGRARLVGVRDDALEERVA